MKPDEPAGEPDEATQAAIKTLAQAITNACFDAHEAGLNDTALFGTAILSLVCIAKNANRLDFINPLLARAMGAIGQGDDRPVLH